MLSRSSNTNAQAGTQRIWQFGMRALLALVLVNAVCLAVLTQPDVQHEVQRTLWTAYTRVMQAPAGEAGSYFQERVEAELAQGRVVVVHFYVDWDFNSHYQQADLASAEVRYLLWREDAVLLRCDCTAAPSAACKIALAAYAIHPSTIVAVQPGTHGRAQGLFSGRAAGMFGCGRLAERRWLRRILRRRPRFRRGSGALHC